MTGIDTTIDADIDGDGNGEGDGTGNGDITVNGDDSGDINEAGESGDRNADLDRDGDRTSEVAATRIASESVEHVDSGGRVIEIVTRAEMRARTLRHRSVGIIVFDHTDRLLIHKRADWKDVFPGAWDLAFGGVCDVGEDWRTAAERELFEEAGITGALVDAGPYHYESETVAVVGRLFGCRHSGPFRFDDGEVTAVEWLDLDNLEHFVAHNEVPDDSASIITPDAVRRILAAYGSTKRWTDGH